MGSSGEVKMFTGNDKILAAELVETIRFFERKNWTPATSTNYSARSIDVPGHFIISRSGVDKSKFSPEDLILINADGDIHPCFRRPGVKSSAETGIHTELYQKYPETNCVLHSHSVLSTTLSFSQAKNKKIVFEGLEILKGLEGNETHEHEQILPIVANSQHIPDIMHELSPYLTNKDPLQGFLIAGHGLYAWGKDIATAKRHIETFEFLFECYHTMRRQLWEC
jgi:methylthioribulose-1-phosphate dehydratase